MGSGIFEVKEYKCALDAALLGEKEGAIADTYILCNPPYSLESLGMDKVVNHNQAGSLDPKTAAGQFGSVITEARTACFRRFQGEEQRKNAQSPVA